MTTTTHETEGLARLIDRHPHGLQIEIRDLCDGQTYRWNGAHTVNVYDFDGNEIDVFSIGDFAFNHASLKEFFESVLSHINENLASVES